MIRQGSPTRPRRAMTVHVAIYEHRHDRGITVFRKEEDDLQWKFEIAKEYWPEFFQEPPPPDASIAEDYFERMTEAARPEFFEIIRCQVHRPSSGWCARFRVRGVAGRDEGCGAERAPPLNSQPKLKPAARGF